MVLAIDDIAFDESTARALIAQLRETEDALWGIGARREQAIVRALEEFRGVYADLFQSACVVEAEDRGRLRSELDEAALWLEYVIAQAKEERAYREKIRRAAFNEVVSGGAVPGPGYSSMDPSESGVHVKSVFLGFAPRERTRAAKMSYKPDSLMKIAKESDVSSARVTDLRGFVQTSEIATRDMDENRDQLLRLYAAYQAWCSWAPLDALDRVLEGFGQFIQENVSDERWILDVAAGFEKAGGSLPPDSVRTVRTIRLLSEVTSRNSDQLAPFLFRDGLSVQQVANAWDRFVAANNDPEVVERFIEEYCFELAGLDGIPFDIQDRAGRESLDQIGRIPATLPEYDPEFHDRLARAHERMGIMPPLPTYSSYHRTQALNEFAEQIQGVNKALQRASDSTKDTVQLVGLGSHNEAVTAGVVLGDLDQAPNLSVLVSGMNSSTSTMAGPIESLGVIKENDPDHAVMTLIGYEAPGVTQVKFDKHAREGAEQLVRFFQSVEVNNPDRDQLTVIAHSYGTNTAAEAFKDSPVGADNFISLGSAGLHPGTTREDLNVENIYVTEAQKDIWAPLGRFGRRVNPANLDDVCVFSSEETSTGQAVTGHSLNGAEKTGEIGYLDSESSSSHGTRDITQVKQGSAPHLDTPGFCLID